MSLCIQCRKTIVQILVKSLLLEWLLFTNLFTQFSNFYCHYVNGFKRFIGRAGLPSISVNGGTSLNTKQPGEMIEPLPMRTPLAMFELG